MVSVDVGETVRMDGCVVRIYQSRAASLGLVSEELSSGVKLLPQLILRFEISKEECLTLP